LVYRAKIDSRAARLHVKVYGGIANTNGLATNLHPFARKAGSSSGQVT
jgi:hypothetical protein